MRTAVLPSAAELISRATEHLQGLHDQKLHAGLSFIDGFDILGQDEYEKSYGDVIDEQSVDLGEGNGLTVRYFKGGDSHVVIDLPDNKYQVLDELPPDSLRRLSDGIAEVIDGESPDADSSDHSFYILRDDAGDLRLYPKGDEGPYFEVSEDDGNRFIDALREMADGYEDNLGLYEDIGVAESLAVAMPTAAELVSRALEKYNPLQPRDADGQWSDGVPGFASALDKLKLSRRAPAGFVVQSSKKLKTDYADVGIAEVDGPDGSQVRVGVIGNESGKWDAGFVGEARKAQLRQEIDRKQALMDSDDDDVDDDIEDQISELQSELEDLEGERTAIVSPEAMADFRRQLGEGLEVAKANKAKVDADAKAQDAIDEKRAAIIAEFSDAEMERGIHELSWRLRQAQGIVRDLENDLASGRSRHGWDPEFTAERLASWKEKVAKYEAELAPLLARRAELMPPDARARLEDLDRQFNALNDVAIDDMLTAAEVSAPNGARIRAEIWGSDDEDEQWVSTRLYVLTPGETSDDIDDDYGSFRGLKGLSKLITALDTSRSPEAFDSSLGVHSMLLFRALEAIAVMSPSPAVRLMMLARALEADDTFSRRGHLITVNRGSKGRFARKVGSAIDAAAAVRAIADADQAPKKPRAPRNAVAKALASGDSSALDGMSRESLRREAKARGIDVPRGVSEDVLKDMLWDDENSSKSDGAASAMADGFGGQDSETSAAKRERADSLLSDMPSDQAGRDRVHTEVGGLILDADRMDAASPGESWAARHGIKLDPAFKMDPSPFSPENMGLVAPAKPARERAKKAPADTSAIVDNLRAKKSATGYVDQAGVADELKTLSHADLDAVAAGLGYSGFVKGTRLQKAKTIASTLYSGKNSAVAMERSTRQTDVPAAASDKPLSVFGQIKASHKAAMDADIAARAAKKAAAEKPKRRAPAGRPKAADRPDRAEQMAAISGDPDIWGKLKAAHAEDEANRASAGNSPVSSAVDALRPMVDNPQRGDREKTAEVLGKLSGKQLDEVAERYGFNVKHLRTVGQKRTQLTENLVGHKLNALTFGSYEPLGAQAEQFERNLDFARRAKGGPVNVAAMRAQLVAVPDADGIRAILREQNLTDAQARALAKDLGVKSAGRSSRDEAIEKIVNYFHPKSD